MQSSLECRAHGIIWCGNYPGPTARPIRDRSRKDDTVIPRTLRGHARARGYGIIPALQRRMVESNRKAGRFGRKVDGDNGRNAGHRDLVPRHEWNLREPGFEIIIKIRYAKLAALNQRRNLLILMRSGNRPSLQTGDRVANRLHYGSKAFLFGAAVPHR